jgi:hypothetical protein
MSREDRIVQIDKNKISLDELDEIFEINHMESESKKSKRHRMLKNIEQKYLRASSASIRPLRLATSLPPILQVPQKKK